MIARHGTALTAILIIIIGIFFTMTSFKRCEGKLSHAEIMRGFSIDQVCTHGEAAQSRNIILGTGLIISGSIIGIGGLSLLKISEIERNTR